MFYILEITCAIGVNTWLNLCKIIAFRTREENTWKQLTKNFSILNLPIITCIIKFYSSYARVLQKSVKATVFRIFFIYYYRHTLPKYKVVQVIPMVAKSKIRRSKETKQPRRENRRGLNDQYVSENIWIIVIILCFFFFHNWTVNFHFSLYCDFFDFWFLILFAQLIYSSYLIWFFEQYLQFSVRFSNFNPSHL